MKAKFLFLSALVASMTLISCNKEENRTEDPATSPKSVTISLANVVPATRSADSPITGGNKVELSNFQVFFTDGTNLYKGQTIEGEEAVHYFTNLDEFNDENCDAVFHFLPANVNKVVVIGNLGTENEATTYEGLKEELAIDDQQDAEDLYLYDEVDLTTASSEDEAGHPLYKADVTLEPRVSRIEVASFKYDAVDADTPRKYESIEIDQIMLSNFYQAADSRTGEISGRVNRAKNAFNEGTIFEIFNDEPDGWQNDVFSTEEDAQLPVITLDNTGNYEYTYTDPRPAYHFFPNATNISTDDHPQLLVKLIGINGGTKTPLYLATDVFNPAVTADVAKIYSVNFVFKDGDLDEPEKCVQVTVSVASWDVVPVTPEF